MTIEYEMPDAYIGKSLNSREIIQSEREQFIENPSEYILNCKVRDVGIIIHNDGE
jgi:hypothetical protein